MLLICLNKTSDTQAAILQAGVFGVNILAEDQGQVAYQFAKKGPGKFEGVGIVRGNTGIPLVQGALAHLECEVGETVTGGTHTVFLARVKGAAGKEGAFRHSARELLALSAWRANDATATRQWLDMIANDGDTPPG